MNQHVNNVKYISWVLEVSPLSARLYSRLKKLHVSTARIGDRICSSYVLCVWIICASNQVPSSFDPASRPNSSNTAHFIEANEPY